MSRRSSQLTNNRGVSDKPASPRLTLRLQQVRGMDRKTMMKTPETSPSDNRSHYNVSVDVEKDSKSEECHDLYEFKSGTEASPPLSLRSQVSVPGGDADSCNPTSSCASDSDKFPQKSPQSLSEEKHKLIGSAKLEDKKEDNKRNATEMDIEGEGENNKKKKKEDIKEIKENFKNGNPRNGRSTVSLGAEKGKNGNHKNCSSKVANSNWNSDRKSPPAGGITACNASSPKGSIGKASSNLDSDSGSDSEDKKSQDGMPKVPPLKIVIPTSAGEQEQGNRNGKNIVTRQLPYVVNTSQDDSATVENCVPSAGERRDSPSSGDSDKSSHRITRSQKALHSLSGEASPDSSCSKVEEKIEEPSPIPPLTQSVDLHPRKRKLRPREADGELPSHPATTSGEQQVTNCYDIYLNIRRQIDRRRRNLFPVQPKPPQGFKDYLMNRCSYVLAGNAQSRLSVPMIPPPQSLAGPLRDLFIEQEKERYTLRLQHLIEKEKLVLSVEQEILRVHGRAARALANQSLPFSVCTILKDEEVYNVITPEQEEKDRNARSRYNGRLFLSWLQDVDDKWEKIKEAMLLRHHNEAESMHAVQKMDWEWKLRENSVADHKTVVVIDDLHVPIVHVSDDFDLLPA